ncbi:fatty acyl-AMP ligase [Corallococcus terminator]|uniref:Fatty acyl-AMP ligase n=1 Tax=Corallococcus terminator TaxID=2316733 RepID=A0A3A8JCX5_9BACT|nr:fatty acyl-AMP ligase [Corallococcus terminator]RKG93572.1 fatty acyl-AMP ligase [Corallococcus terminator]
MLPANAPVETLTDLLRWRTQRHPESYAYTFLPDGDGAEQNWTYAELDRQSRAVAAQFQAYKAGGERALLLYPPGLEYLGAFYGCLYANVIAVPAYPPQYFQSISRILSILQDARPRFALTTAAILETVRALQGEYPQLGDIQWIATDALPAGIEETWKAPNVKGDDLAFLQYTSGSTSTPKGVMVLHRNLMSNQAMIQRGMALDEQSTIVSWLPLYHDMGLIGTVMQALYNGSRAVLMSPWSFLQKPSRWLRAISHYRANLSGAPNFAYALCVRKVKPEQQEGLDLSSWRVAFNGAEPVRADTLNRFAEAFAPVGFQRQALYPCYGLAEATLFVTGVTPDTGFTQRTVDASALEKHRVVTVEPGTANARPVVSSGRSWGDSLIRIVEPETFKARADGEVGEIWVAGPHITQGYWGRAETDTQTFGARIAGSDEGPFLRTGDLGFLLDGELFVTGRLKDMIIIDGRNHYPHDIEQTVESQHPAFRVGSCAAFSVERDNEEKLVVLMEVDRRYAPPAGGEGALDLKQVTRKLQQAVAAAHSVELHDFVLLQSDEILKTSSGKVQRRACREKYLEGSLQRWQG